MKTVITKYSVLKASDNRLDAEYHLSDALEIKRLLAKGIFNCTPLNLAVDKIFLGNIFRRTYVESEENGFPYLTASDMMKVDKNTGKFLSKRYTSQQDALMLKKDWILVSCSGTLGNVMFTNNDFEGKIGSHDLIRIIPKLNGEIKPGFLYAFLASRYGYSLLTQSSYGGVVKHIEPINIQEIPIPLFPQTKQDEIHNLIIKAAALREEANSQLRSAIVEFERRNGLIYGMEVLDKSENSVQLGFRIKKSELFLTTIKARNYSLRARKIIEIWESKRGKKLEDILIAPFEMGVRASFKRISDNKFKGHDLVSQGDIHDQNPMRFKHVKVKKLNEKDTARRACLIMPSAGTLGESEIFTRPLLVRNNFEGKILSEVIGKFYCANEMDAAYLFTALSSKAGFRILRAFVYGTNLMYPNWELLKNINIPWLEENAFKEISELVLSAFDKRGYANNLENTAISLIEKEIESWQN